jgi:glycosyltransferase involved in cell wall biosynthesis
VRSGISAYSAELLPHIAEDADLDVYVASDPGPHRLPATSRALRVLSAHDLLWQHRDTPYDLIVYQLGNATCHDYMWPYFERWPGLTVLHDGQLHHARAGRLLHRARYDDYRAEFRLSHPDAPAGAADYAVAGFGGAVSYFFPMLRLAMRCARRVAVHNPWLARDLREEFVGLPIDVLTMGVGDPVAEPDAAARIRRRHGIDPGARVLAAFGMVTPEKRLTPILRALASLARTMRDLRLLLVGDHARHYDVDADARAHGVLDRLVVTGFVDDAEMPAYLAAADVCLNLRWPSTRETSASWPRCLAAGRPTVITDLADLVHVPALDPRTWSVQHADGSPGSGTPEPVAVSIDILDEDHSLRLALTRLLADEPLRQRLGTAARAYWREHHTLARMAADYRRTIAAALGTPPQTAEHAWQRTPLPAHVFPDPERHTRALLAPFEVRPD